MFTAALKEAFMEMWRNATPAENRIEQLKTGKPIEESYVIREPSEAQTKLKQILDSAGQNVMTIMPSNGLRSLLETKLFQEHSKKNLEFRIMAPIDLDNIAAAQKLSETFQIRSVPISYLTMLTVDNKHAFIFRTSPLEGEIHVPFHWENVFYTNDNRYVERVSEMLDDMWKRGITLDDIVSSPKEHEKRISVSSVDTVSTVIDTMLKNNINLVVVVDGERPMGIVSQRDILEKIVKNGRNPAKTLSKEIMSFPVVAVDAEEPITEALATMKKKGPDKIVVFKEGKFAGVLSGGQTSKTKTRS
jgi:CBS domain-containing protein